MPSPKNPKSRPASLALPPTPRLPEHIAPPAGTCLGLAVVLGVNWGRTHASEYHALAGASGLVSMVLASYLVG